MKKLFLHIGCGKTGSSALQVWLYKNHEAFLSSGVLYPKTGKDIKNDYQITSGNGVKLSRDLLDNKNLDCIFEAFSSGVENVLFSSENFQKFGEAELIFLKEKCEAAGIEVHILAFVRDVYDVVFSLYVQAVKRNNYSKSFRDYVSGLKKLQQFEVVNLWEKFFPEIRVVHYDTYKNNLNAPFLSWIGVDSNKIPEMSKNKVNRTLTLAETEFQRNVNQLYSKKFGDLDFSFSAALSDNIIFNDPEKKGEILFDQFAFDKINSLFEVNVNNFNKKYFNNGVENISIFTPGNKIIVNEVPHIDKFILSGVQALVAVTEKISTKGVFDRIINQNLDDYKNNTDMELKISDPRLPDLLRSEAIRLEKSKSTFPSAYILMLAAGVLRPGGIVIKKKIAEYRDKIKNIGAKNNIF